MKKYFKPSFYNMIYKVDNRYWVFNTLTQGLIEVPQKYVNILENKKIVVNEYGENICEDIEYLIENEFLVEYDVNELKFLKNKYNLDKYDRDYMSLTIVPTLECNCSCFYCFERQHIINRDNKFDWDTISEGILKLIQLKLPYIKTLNVAWFGGEPLLKPEAINELSKKIITLTEQYNVKYTSSLTTNGLCLLSIPGIWEMLIENKISNLQLTIDGNPEWHNKTRKLLSSKKDTFFDILNAIEELYKRGFNLSVRINLNRNNLESIYEVFDILEQKKLKNLKIYFGQLINYSDKNDLEVYLSVEEYAIAITQLHKELRERGFAYGIDSHYPSSARPCMANRIDSVVVDCNGNMYKCRTQTGEYNKSIGNVLRLENQRQDEAVREIDWLEWSPFQYKICTECKYLPLCMAGCPYTLYDDDSAQPICVEWKYNVEYFVSQKIKDVIENEQN